MTDSSGVTVPIPFADLLGFELVLFEAGSSRILYTPKPEHLNSFGVAHGGALMTLMDVTLAAAARSLQPEMGAITIEMKTSFMQPGRGALRCEGRVLHRSKSMAFTEASIFDAAGGLCAHATGTFKYMPRRPLSVGGATQAHVPTD